MFCSNCGKELKDNVKYCSKCGYPVTRQSNAIVEERTFPQDSHEKLWGSWIKWIVAGFPVILLIVAIVFLAVPKVNQMRYESLIKEGNRYLTEMNYEEAVIAFTKAIRIEEKEPDAYIGRGNAYTGLAEKDRSSDGDRSSYQSAESDYKKALKLDKTHTDVYEKLSEVYLAQNKADKAEKILEQGYSATKNEKLSTRLAEIQERIQEDYGDGFAADSDNDPETSDTLEEEENTADSEDPARIAAYENVLNQYRTLCAIPDDGTVDFLMDDSLYETEYPDVNPRMIFYYHAYHNSEFYYNRYDVDQDGQDELIMGFGSLEEMAFIDVLTYDSSEKVISLNNDSGCVHAYLGDRSQLEFCTDGTLIIISSSSFFNVNYTFLSLENGEFHKANEYDQDIRERPDRSFYDGTGYLTEAEMNAILNEYTYIPEDSFQWIPLAQKENQPNAAIRETQSGNVMMAEKYSKHYESSAVYRMEPDSNNIFNSGIDRRSIKKIVFLDNLKDKPSEALDISANQDASVWAWVESSEMTSIHADSEYTGELFDLYIAGDGGVDANPDCGFLFYGYENTEEICFNNCFYTGKVFEMKDMFANCISMRHVDVNGFCTSQVTNMCDMFSGCKTLQSLDVSNFDTSQVANMNGLFYKCETLQSLDVSNFITSKVTDMQCMFAGCKSLQKLDVNNFDTSQVTMMNIMFSKCRALKSLHLNNFDTSKVRGMCWMFSECNSLLELDVSGFDTSNVTGMEEMFYGCSSLLKLDVSSFDTSKVSNMYAMFMNCKSLQNLDISSFDTSQVEIMQLMFSGCDSLLEMDLSCLNTSHVTDMSYMFRGCAQLQRINLAGFDTSHVTNMSHMFEDCQSLQNLDISAFDTSSVENDDNMLAGVPLKG